MVTLTRCIDMYLIGPFSRPQFSEGRGPSYWPFRGPSSRLRGAISSSNRSSDDSGAPPGAIASSDTPRLAAVEPNEQSATTTAGIRTTSSGPALRSRACQPASRCARTRPRATTDAVQEPRLTGRDRRDEHDPRIAFPARTDRRHHRDHQPDGAQTQRRGHSRAAVNIEKRRRPAEPPRRSDHGRRTAPPHASEEPRGTGSRRRRG